jgi:hypothetical protein
MTPFEANNNEIFDSHFKVVVTVFYSNFSGNCKALLQKINNSNLMDKLSLKFINIDNNVMKDIVTKKFSVVPAIVVMIEDEISLYTGDNVFEWFNIVSQSYEIKQPQTEIKNSTDQSYDVVSSDLKNTNSLFKDKNSPSETIEHEKGNSEPCSKASILDIAAEILKSREML